MKYVALLIGALIFSISYSFAQDTRGQIVGRVIDPTSAVIPRTSVQAVNIATGVRTSTQTNDSGDYILPLLNPGDYEVTVKATGFRDFHQAGIQIQVESRLTLNVKMELGQASQSVNVTASSDLMDLSPNSSGLVVDKQLLLELPLKDGSPLTLQWLAPGVLDLNTGGSTHPYDLGVGQTPPINGARGGSNGYTLDGAPNDQWGCAQCGTAATQTTVAYIPPPGVVEEFKVSTAPDASTGFFTGGVVNLSLKSGTNQLHGQAYNFFQNPKLNASQFFSNAAGLPKPELRLNRWGANGNGPVYIPHVYDGRNRTFWMYAYEGIYTTSPRGTLTQAVPTAKERTGDFSDLLAIGPQYQIYDPYSTTPAANGRFSRVPVPGNIIPSSRMNPTARNIADLWSLPNLPGTPDGTNNWTTSGPQSDDYNTHLFRIDHNPSEHDRMFLRGNTSFRHQIHDERFHDAVGTNLYIKNQGIAFDDVHIFSPRFLIDTRYDYSHFSWNTIPLQVGWDLVGLGFSQSYVNQILTADAGALKLPNISVTGYGVLANTNGPSIRYNDVHDVSSNLTYVLHSHTLRFGGAFLVFRDNSNARGQGSGSFTFNGNWVRGPLDSAAAAPMGQTMAAFLYGLPSSGSFPISASYAEQSMVSGLYFQDDWKLTQRFTINMGLRYELELPTTERYNRSVRSFDFAAASPIAGAALANYAAAPIPEVPAANFRTRGGLTFAGSNGQPRDLWNQSDGHLLPRIGLAYAINPRMVVRSSYGVFFGLIGVTEQASNQTGFTQQTSFAASQNNGQTYVANLTNPFPGGFLQPARAAGGLSTALGQAATFFNPNLTNPYVQRWQINISRELPWTALVDIGYVGNRATHTLATRNFDALPAQYLSTSPVRDPATINYLSAAVANPFYPLLPGTSLSGQTVAKSQLLEPFPQFTSVTANTNQGFSWYHSLQARIQKRFSNNLTFTTVWTWSKFMEATAQRNDSDPLPEKVISDQDRPHRVVVTALWELPFGHGRRWAKSVPTALNGVIGGWQVQGIYEFQSGPPLGFGDAILTTDVSKIPLPSNQRTLQRWFNTSAFVTNSTQQLLDNIQTLSTRFTGVRGDGLNHFDLSASKLTRIHEGVNLQFRAEFINALNHPEFSAPNTTPTSQSFGVVTAEGQWLRTIQLALKLLF